MKPITIVPRPLRSPKSFPLDIKNFLNPIDKVVEDDLDTIDDVVLSEFLLEVDEDEIMEEQAQVFYHEAIQALKTLYIYEEQ